MTSPPAAAILAVLLADQVGAEEAGRRLGRTSRRFALFRSRLSGTGEVPAARQARATEALELVRLPVAAAQTSSGARARARGGDGATESAARASVRFYLVERVLGHVWALSCDLERRIDGVERRALDPAEAAAPAPLPARLAIDDCRRPLDTFAARAAFAFGRGRARDVAELGPLAAASYPFWLRYRRGRDGRIDFAALDAVTGTRPGSALRAAIAAALIDADAS